MKSQNTYHSQTAKFLASVMQNMPIISSDLMQKWIENPAFLSETLTNALSEFEKTEVFPVYRVVMIGTHKSNQDLLENLELRNVVLQNWSRNIVSVMPLSKAEKDLVLHVATVKHLTGKNASSYHEICKAIKAKGYMLCPAETAAQICLQYPERDENEALYFAMKTIQDASGSPSIFRVFGQNDAKEVKLFGSDGHLTRKWDGATMFIFASRE